MNFLDFSPMRTKSDLYISTQNQCPSTHMEKTSNYLNLKLNKKKMLELEQDPTFKNRLEEMIEYSILGEKINLHPDTKKTPPKLLQKCLLFKDWLCLFCNEYGYDLNNTLDVIALIRHINQNKTIFCHLSEQHVPVGRDDFYIIVHNLINENKNGITFQ